MVVMAINQTLEFVEFGRKLSVEGSNISKASLILMRCKCGMKEITKKMWILKGVVKLRE